MRNLDISYDNDKNIREILVHRYTKENHGCKNYETLKFSIK